MVMLLSYQKLFYVVHRLERVFRLAGEAIGEFLEVVLRSFVSGVAFFAFVALAVTLPCFGDFLPARAATLLTFC